MTLVLAGKPLAMHREKDKLTLAIRPTTTTQQDGKTLVVMMDDGTGDPPRSGHVIATGPDPIQVRIDQKDCDSLLRFIQDTPIEQTVRLAMETMNTRKAGKQPAKSSVNETDAAMPKVTIVIRKPDDGKGRPPYTLVSFQRGGL